MALTVPGENTKSLPGNQKRKRWVEHDMEGLARGC